MELLEKIDFEELSKAEVIKRYKELEERFLQLERENFYLSGAITSKVEEIEFLRKVILCLAGNQDKDTNPPTRR